MTESRLLRWWTAILNSILRRRWAIRRICLPAFRYNFRRLSKMLVDVVCRLAGEFAESDFEAKAFELPIDVDGAVHSKVIPLQDGGSLRIRGSVDRVDVLEQDGQQFVRVVDYKSGARPFVWQILLTG